MPAPFLFPPWSLKPNLLCAEKQWHVLDRDVFDDTILPACVICHEFRHFVGEWAMSEFLKQSPLNISALKRLLLLLKPRPLWPSTRHGVAMHGAIWQLFASLPANRDHVDLAGTLLGACVSITYSFILRSRCTQISCCGASCTRDVLPADQSQLDTTAMQHVTARLAR